MDKRVTVKSAILYVIFGCYIFLLIHLLFLSRVPLSELFNQQRTYIRSFNLIPFHSIRLYMNGGFTVVKSVAFKNVIGNIVIFAPLGVYLLLFKKNKKLIANFLIIFMLSLCVEAMQWLIGAGATDIDDIILNCLGGWAGILGYKFFMFLIRDENKVNSIFTILLAAIGLPVIIIFAVNLIINM